MLSTLLLKLSVCFLAVSAACNVDEDCSLNGICSATTASCSCNPGWKGVSCALLDRLPQPSRSAAGIYGLHPNVTSWGGNVLVDDATGLHHLYVTEIAGENCHLVAWESHSTIVHAVSQTGMGGPFVKESVAVNVEGHNPQAIRYKGGWVIFHIGGGSAPGTSVKPCPGPPPPGCPTYKTHNACPIDRCRWNDGAGCTTPPPPPLPPTPPALCASQNKVEGYSCKGDTCGGPAGVARSGHNCGAYATVPTLACTSDCAAKVAALCDKDPACRSFSLENKYNGSGALHSQTFTGGSESIVTNSAWTTWLKAADANVNAFAVDGNAAAAAAALTRQRIASRELVVGKVDTPSSFGAGYVGSTIHTSATPGGPFEPLNTTFPHCNNPSPFVMKNGTIVVLCTWHIVAADALEGPWRSIPGISINPSTRMNVSGNWEDPFLWQDVNDHWPVNQCIVFHRESARDR